MIDDIFAALTFFTRLPWWRLRQVPADSFKRLVAYWPLAGWLTGGVMALVYWVMVMADHPFLFGLLLAWIARLLLTGALHEDGLADFIDGFGGGRTRQRTLAIMKDSHIGTYGVLTLIVYAALWLYTTTILAGYMEEYFFCLLFLGDVWAKWCASQMINLLPYVRREDECKIQAVYDPMSTGSFFTGLLLAFVPLMAGSAWLFWEGFEFLIGGLWVSAAVTIGVMLLLVRYIRHRLGGYTGDCCGATFLLCELSFLIMLNIVWMFF